MFDMAPHKYTYLSAFLILLPTAFAALDPELFSRYDVIERDVAIVGGGAAGSHAAVRLREDYNRSVVLIEREGILGGHVDTYYDQPAGQYRDFGVQIYFPYQDAMDFITRFNLTLVQGLAPRGATTNRYVDFKTGAALPNYIPADSGLVQNATVNLYHALVDNGYDKFIEPGFWNLPAGPKIPNDLLLPIGEFAVKYNASAALTRIWQGTGGGAGSRGDFEKVQTLTVLQSFSPAYMKVFLGQANYYHIQDGNQLLYDKIAALLGNDVLVNTTVIDSERSDDGVKLLVSNGQDEKIISAKKLIFAIPPTRENLQSFDLNDEETDIFSKPQYGRYHTAIISHPSLPRGVELTNIPTTAVNNSLHPFLSPPFILSISSYGNDSALFSIGSSGNPYTNFTPAAGAALARTNVQKMAAVGMIPSLAGEEVQVMQWSDHGPGGFGVSAEEARAGWWERMYGLQGRRSTWFTGNAIAIDFSTLLWNFNDDLIVRILKAW